MRNPVAALQRGVAITDGLVPGRGSLSRRRRPFVPKARLLGRGHRDIRRQGRRQRPLYFSQYSRAEDTHCVCQPIESDVVRTSSRVRSPGRFLPGLVLRGDVGRHHRCGLA